jgi:REP element-mobilizing transposase RayT
MRPNAVGREVAACWNRIPTRFSNVLLDSFVVMPDHLHGILMVDDRDAGALPAVLDAFQAASADRIDFGIWKGRSHRHFIRDSDELDRIRHYIRDNPSRWPQDPRDLPPFGRA